MRAKRSTGFFVAAIVTLATLTACSDSNYGGAGADVKPRKGAEGEMAPSGGMPNAQGEAGGQKLQPKASPEFFSSGKSLDLHVIMDKSGSLWADPNSRSVDNGFQPKMGTGSDPTCKRMDALLDLVDGLRTKLTKGEFVRLTVVTFGQRSSVVGSVSDVLKESRQAIDSRLRAGICEFPGQLETTHYAEGISASLAELRRLRMVKKLEVETNLFFSDGAAKDRPGDLEAAISELNSSFPKRVFGILLGNTSDNCTLSEGGRALSTLECLRKAAGGEAGKVIQSSDAAGLSAAMTSLLAK